MCTHKQIKLSHLISMYGHTYLMSNIVDRLCQFEKIVDIDRDKFLDRELDSESEEFEGGQQALYQFVNSVDSDFSTPLIYSLRNKKNKIVKLLLKCEKVSL
jgi:hypothetical protein